MSLSHAVSHAAGIVCCCSEAKRLVRWVGLSGLEPLTSALSATGRRFAGVSGWREDFVAGAARGMAGSSGMLGRELLCLPRLSPFALWCL